MFLGLILLQSRVVMSQDWYSAVHPSWAAPLLTDQRLGAGIAWAFGEIPAAVVMAVLVVQWIRADERESDGWTGPPIGPPRSASTTIWPATTRFSRRRGRRRTGTDDRLRLPIVGQGSGGR